MLHHHCCSSTYGNVQNSSSLLIKILVLTCKEAGRGLKYGPDFRLETRSLRRRNTLHRRIIHAGCQAVCSRQQAYLRLLVSTITFCTLSSTSSPMVSRTGFGRWHQWPLTYTSSRMDLLGYTPCSQIQLLECFYDTTWKQQVFLQYVGLAHGIQGTCVAFAAVTGTSLSCVLWEFCSRCFLCCGVHLRNIACSWVARRSLSA